MPQKIALLQILTAVLVSLASLLGVKLFVSGELAGDIVKHAGYWIMLGTVLLTLHTLWKTLNWSSFSLRKLWAGHGAGIICVLLCSGYLHLHEPHMMKIYYDEPAISGVGMMMHEYRETCVPFRGHLAEGRIFVMNSYEDKRPYFFAFLISVLHDMSGYRVANVFILNGLLTVALLGGLYSWAAHVQGQRVGIFCVLLLTSLPLLAQNVTGAGFEVLNMVMLLALAGCMMRYLEAPGTQWLNLMVLTSVLLAQTRYESILYTVPVALCILLKWWRHKKVALTWTSSLAPALLTPALLVQQLFFANRAFWQLEEDEGNPFALHFLQENLEKALFYFFSFDTTTTNSLLLSLVILVTFVFLPLVYLRDKSILKERAPESAYLLIIPFTIANFLLLMLYYWGQMDDPLVSRLGLPLMLLGVLAVPIVLRQMLKGSRLPHLVNGLVAFYIFGVTTWANSQAHISNRFMTPKEQWLMIDTIERYYPDKKILVIAPSTVPFIIHGYAAIPPSVLYFYSPKVKYVLDTGYYDEVLLLQRFDIDATKGYQPVDDSTTPLDQFFETEVIRTEWYRMQVLSQVARVTAVKPLTTELKKKGMKDRFAEAYNETQPQAWEYQYTEDPPEGFEDQNAYILHRKRMLP